MAVLLPVSPPVNGFAWQARERRMRKPGTWPGCVGACAYVDCSTGWRSRDGLSSGRELLTPTPYITPTQNRAGNDPAASVESGTVLIDPVGVLASISTAAQPAPANLFHFHSRAHCSGLLLISLRTDSVLIPVSPECHASSPRGLLAVVRYRPDVYRGIQPTEVPGWHPGAVSTSGNLMWWPVL